MYVWRDTFGSFNAGSYKWEDPKTATGSLDQVFHDYC